MLSSLAPGDWIVVLDLQDSYFHIPVLLAHQRCLQFVMGQEHFHLPVLPAHWRYLWFEVEQERFQFAVVTFRLTCASLVFMNVMAELEVHLPRSGVRVFPYLNDCLLKLGCLPQAGVKHLQTTANLLSSWCSLSMCQSYRTPFQTLLFI